MWCLRIVHCKGEGRMVDGSGFRGSLVLELKGGKRFRLREYGKRSLK